VTVSVVALPMIRYTLLCRTRGGLGN
jgi:hypothetical protein